jgi:hypothetical protein
MGQSSANKNPALHNSYNQQKSNDSSQMKHNESVRIFLGEYIEYNLLSEYLVAVSFTEEDSIAIVIHSISGGNHAVHMQWPLQP